MYKQNNRWNRNKKNNNVSKANNNNEQLPDESNNIVITNFRQYAKELDDKHDRYERIVKQSRDITIESKRIIFLLHNIDSKKNNKEQILKTANGRLTALFSNQFLQISRELDGLDAYQYTKAFSAGLQEFVEAYTYYKYLSNERITDWDDLQNMLLYEKSMETNDNAENQKQETESLVSDQLEKTESNDDAMETLVLHDKKPEHEPSDKPIESYKCLVQPIEFMLGVGDLSGEVMRHCINALNSGDLDECFQARQFLQFLYTGFMGLGPRNNNKELSHKIYTLRQSVQKVENVCYNIKVRGGEATKLCSDNTFGNKSSKIDMDDDEGFANY